jgi:hypothetical protein
MSIDFIGPRSRPTDDAPDGAEPRALPVEPDEGLVPAGVPDDTERERPIDPET